MFREETKRQGRFVSSGIAVAVAVGWDEGSDEATFLPSPGKVDLIIRGGRRRT